VTVNQNRLRPGAGARRMVAGNQNTAFRQALPTKFPHARYENAARRDRAAFRLRDGRRLYWEPFAR
jgi:hypothetical protein